MAASWRTTPLPPNWVVLKKATHDRDGWQCRAIRRDGTRCPVTHHLECHHTGDNTDHTLENLITLCSWHHERVTSQQANAARSRVTEQRPRPKHPGLR